MQIPIRIHVSRTAVSVSRRNRRASHGWVSYTLFVGTRDDNHDCPRFAAKRGPWSSWVLHLRYFRHYCIGILRI